MQIDVTNGKRFTEYDALAAVASGEDVLLVRLADGTGVKRIPLSAVKAFINGDLTTLETEDKTSLIAAINEVFGLVGTNAQDIKALKELTTMLGQTGASRANSFIYEHDLGTSFTAEQSADRITPARAGTTCKGNRKSGLVVDHPRSRGNHLFMKFIKPLKAGSPPLAREPQQKIP